MNHLKKRPASLTASLWCPLLAPPQIVENSVCTLRNLSYRLEVEMPSSRLLGNQELDSLLGFSSPAKELDYLCWGKRRRGRKRGGWPDDKVGVEGGRRVRRRRGKRRRRRRRS